MRKLWGPPIPQEDFEERSVTINRTILRAGTIFGVVTELFNMSRVLLMTNTKLGSLNNRIYFSFYLSYFLFCAIFLVIDLFFKLSVRARSRIYMVLGVVLLCWHVLFNLYDIYRGNALGYFTITTAVFFMAGLMMYRPVYTLCCLGASYIVFVWYLNLMLSSGEVLNYTATFFLCCIIYLVRYKHLRIEVAQTNRIRAVQQELSDTQRDFRLTVEQYELIKEKERSITFEWDIQKDWIRFSKEWKLYFDHPEDIYGFQSFLENLNAVSEQDRKLLLDCMENIRKGMSYQKYEFALPVRTGETRWFEVRVITQTDEKEHPFFGIGMLSDVTEQQQRITQLETEIRQDRFTGLLNKTSIEHYGERRMTELQQGEKVAALILDMDDFKNINDQYGHPVGDYVLREVASCLRQDAPMGARIGRIGGDEFMVLLVGRDVSTFEDYAHDVLKRVQNIRYQGETIGVNCSIGFIISSEESQTFNQLYQKTDQALYQAKNQGKGQVADGKSPLPAGR